MKCKIYTRWLALTLIATFIVACAGMEWGSQKSDSTAADGQELFASPTATRATAQNAKLKTEEPMMTEPPAPSDAEVEDYAGAPVSMEKSWMAPPMAVASGEAAPPMPMDAPISSIQPPLPGTTLPPTPPTEFNTEGYAPIKENEFLDVGQNPLSTFSIDVDTASYANVRRFLVNHALPPPDAVRIEELVNYFTYSYSPPQDDKPFSIHVEVAECPWNTDHRLARIALKGKEIEANKRPPSNIVFLLDVSGSMEDENKLPLVKTAMRMLANQLTENDSVAIVVYAGASGVVLPPTRGDKKEAILEAFDNLEAGGSTNAGEGIELAYQLAIEKFKPNGTNRVILCTDGDFNVGTTSHGDLLRLIEEKAKSKVFLTVLGFGMGNYKDDTLELLADKGNGNYGYIDTEKEAKKMLVEQMTGTLITIAKDVKIQIEFNPAKVQQYRLIGYENRLLRAEDFHDDKKDAGEIGAGHTVTVFYELVPTGAAKVTTGKVDALKYQTNTQVSTAGTESNELMTVKLRYKKPTADVSELIEMPIQDNRQKVEQASPDFMFATSVVSFGMILQNSKYKGQLNMRFVEELAEEGKGEDQAGYREEFIDLIGKASHLLQK